MLLSCKQATLLIEKGNVLPLSVGEKIRKKLHVSMCSTCRSYEKQSSVINSAILKWFSHGKHVDEKLPDAVKGEILKKIKSN